MVENSRKLHFPVQYIKVSVKSWSLLDEDTGLKSSIRSTPLLKPLQKTLHKPPF